MIIQLSEKQHPNLNPQPSWHHWQAGASWQASQIQVADVEIDFAGMKSEVAMKLIVGLPAIALVPAPHSAFSLKIKSMLGKYDTYVCLKNPSLDWGL